VVLATTRKQGEKMKTTIDMAREADEYADMEWPLRPRGERWQKCRDERFEALVRADEREACARVCDDYDVKYDVCSSDTAEGIALQIRARGNT
jgi:hypothetical protein